MSKVTDFVDKKMVNDLKDFILNRRNGRGGFLRNPKALDSFGSAPDNVTAAYIVWTLTSSGITNLTTEIAALKTIADDSIRANSADAYFLGLLADSLFNLNRPTEALVYTDYLVRFVNPSGNVSRSVTTITNSDGSNRVIETTAIAVIAWMNAQPKYAT